jgi:hypothetical protein
LKNSNPSSRKSDTPPWSVEDYNDACFIVRRAHGQALAYVFISKMKRPTFGREAARPRRGAAHRREHRQAAGAAAPAEALSYNRDLHGEARRQQSGTYAAGCW